jgi:hypothetical protein
MKRLEQVAIQPDGRIVAAGVVAPISLADFGLARCVSDGFLDVSLGSRDGTVTTDRPLVISGLLGSR